MLYSPCTSRSTPESVYSSFKGGEVDAVDLFGFREHAGGVAHHGGPVIHEVNLSKKGGIQCVLCFDLDAWCHRNAVRRGSVAGGVGLSDEPTQSGALTNDRGAGKFPRHPRNI